MTREGLNRWADSFVAFQARFADLFSRRETREQATKYLRGLLSPVERKNSWQVAEAVGDATPDRMQRLLYRVEWDADAVRDRLQAFVLETFGDPEAIGIVDETGFVKKGSKSVGVARQYTGTVGKVDNSQVGTFLSYATPRGHVFLDRRLYLPQAWCQDRQRCREAKVPEAVVFQTKPQQAVAMLEHAWAQGLPMRWVSGDEVYGDAPYLREAIERHGRWYVLGVAATTPVWCERPSLEESARRANAESARLNVCPAAEAPPATSVAAVVAGWSAQQWQRFSVAEGEKGPRLYDWGRARVIESRHHLPGPAVWLLARRSLSDASEIAYYLALAPEETSLLQLALVAATRYSVEQCIEEAKGETGLDHYQVRYWHSWYRHITLSLLAHAWLASIRSQETAQKGGPVLTSLS